MARSSADIKLIVACALLVAGLTVLSGRVIQLQVFAETTSKPTADMRYLDREVLPASRGLILDHANEPLAGNIYRAAVIADRYHLQDPNVAAYGLAYIEARKAADWDQLTSKRRKGRIHEQRNKILKSFSEQEIVSRHQNYAIDVLARPLGLSRKQLRKTLAESKLNRIVIRKDIDKGTADQLEEILREQRVQGFHFERYQRRTYFAPVCAVHTLGYTNHENKGLMGLEAKLDHWLAGRDGYRLRKRNSSGLLLPAHRGETFPPRDGLNVRTTLNMQLQSIVEQELDAGLAEFEANTGAVILMNPHNGNIWAMASRPHFNLNDREGAADAGFNYAVSGAYEPGSTFKVVAIAGALDQKIINYETSIDCGWGVIRDGKVTVYDHHPYGSMPVWKVIQKSSNTGTYRVAKRLGRKNFVDYAHKFGFGQELGIDLINESKGFMHDGTNPTDFSRMCYGYAVATTPLQVATAYSVIANGGLLMRPRITDAILTADGSVFESFPAQSYHRVISETTATQLRKALATVVTEQGTAKRAAVPGYTVGGKTGTAKKINPNGGYYNNRYSVSFAGMLPAENPEFVCLVVIDDPQTKEVKRYGGTIAAPIFARIAERTAAALNIPPDAPVKDTENNLTTASVNLPE